MDTEFHEVAGESISCNSLQIPRAFDFAQLVSDGASPYARLMECRRVSGTKEAVIIEVQATIPQRPAVAIQRSERLKVQFSAEDHWYPEVRVLRRDFPRLCVLHLHLVPMTEPASLCLFAEPWADVRLRLTANELLFRIQSWLNDSAAGTLHRPDQALEPAFMGRRVPLVISRKLIAALVEGTPDLTLDIVQDENRMTLLQARDDRYVSGRALPSLVIPFISKPHEHCIINNQPTNLEELHNQLAPTGINLRGVVRKKLVELARKNRLPAFGFLILLLLLHRKRSESAEPEPEIVAFLCMGEQANKTGLVELARAVGATVAHNNSKRGQDVPVMLMAVHMELTQETAALYSGNDNLDIRLVGVGAGALGSQVIMNAVRGGLTEWVVIDDDHLLPHNLVRYSLSGVWLGHAKAKAVAFEANALLDQTTVTPIVADVLKPHRHANAVEKALKGANAIIDLSASVAVARHLTLDVAAPGKRCSVFVSPSGNDLVFLGEDADRQILLDQIEAQYYRAIVSDDRLKGHLTGGSTVGSCRNLTSRVPQHLMGLHAAQSVKLLRSWLQSEQASASIIRNDAPSSVYSTFTISLGNHIDVGALGGWEVVTDRLFLDELRTQRNQYLPNETGGVLLAHVDAQRHKIYVCHQIPAPPDSERQPTMYIRGCVGLEAEYEHVQKATLNNLVYIGEWHSHPDGCQCAPSNDDLRAGQWLAERTRTGSLPGIMLIAGEREQTCWMLCAQKATTAPVQIFLT